MFERLCTRCDRIVVVWTRTEMDAAFDKHMRERCPITAPLPEAAPLLLLDFDDHVFLTQCGIASPLSLNGPEQ